MQGIDKFRYIHKGMSFAILGSSPTINIYRGQQDISIAVNGAVLCDPVERADYFMAGDKNSPYRRWFEESYKKAKTRIVATFVAPYDKIVCSSFDQRKKFQNMLEADYFHQSDPGGNIRFSPDGLVPSGDHGIFVYADIWEEKICIDQKRLCRGGTISGVAAQMAMVMGAKEIHLYGCSFGDTNRKHYGYDNKEEPGGIDPNHIFTMDYILSRIKLSGVEIFAHGHTNLRLPKKIES